MSVDIFCITSVKVEIFFFFLKKSQVMLAPGVGRQKRIAVQRNLIYFGKMQIKFGDRFNLGRKNLN